MKAKTLNSSQKEKTNGSQGTEKTKEKAHRVSLSPDKDISQKPASES